MKHRDRGGVTLRAGFDLAEAYICNLLEENQQALDVTGNSVKLDLRTYQLVTLRLVSA